MFSHLLASCSFLAGSQSLPPLHPPHSPSPVAPEWHLAFCKAYLPRRALALKRYVPAPHSCSAQLSCPEHPPPRQWPGQLPSPRSFLARDASLTLPAAGTDGVRVRLEGTLSPSCDQRNRNWHNPSCGVVMASAPDSRGFTQWEVRMQVWETCFGFRVADTPATWHLITPAWGRSV